MYERGLIPFMWPGYDYWKYMMSEMPSPYSDISQRMIITSSWDEFADMKKHSILEKVGGLTSSALKFFTVAWLRAPTLPW